MRSAIVFIVIAVACATGVSCAHRPASTVSIETAGVNVVQEAQPIDIDPKELAEFEALLRKYLR